MTNAIFKNIRAAAVALCVLLAPAGPVLAEAPPLAKKERYKVGVSQTELDNPWRIAETQSFRDEAPKCGWDLVETVAIGSAAKQVADVDSLIAQGVDVIFLSPREEKPLVPAVKKAKSAGIPVFLIDRSVDKAAKAGEDYVTNLASDFIHQGRRVGMWLAAKTGGKAKIIQLEGSTGSTPANDRKKGFDDEIARWPEMGLLASHSGDFNRDKGRQVMETLLQAHPDVTAVYAHNDEMAIGAINALKAAGRRPGEDVLVVSIDGTRDALQAIIDGEMAITVESSPFFGPLACAVMRRYADGEKFPERVLVPDRFFDQSNAARFIDEAY